MAGRRSRGESKKLDEGRLGRRLEKVRKRMCVCGALETNRLYCYRAARGAALPSAHR